MTHLIRLQFHSPVTDGLVFGLQRLSTWGDLLVFFLNFSSVKF